MQVSYNWLKDLVPSLTATPEEIEERMSTTGIEVEGVSRRDAGLEKLVVGEILAAEAIPETHLRVCQVAVGRDVTLQIVCGAPNVMVGSKVLVALVGARIAGGVKIKKSKMRGVESQGMLCALDELGVPASINPMKHEEGIYIFPATAGVGDDAMRWLAMDDAIIDLSITPNRADALSMRGVAYEVGAIYDLPVKLDRLLTPATAGVSSNLTEDPSCQTADSLRVTVATDLVATYKMRVVTGVTVASSPLWLQNRLMNAGIRPINNVVDVTNYILIAYGQPLHAFDRDKLGADEILVRAATDGEALTTLDGEDRLLAATDLVITADGRPVALAGVMGGLDTEITRASTTVAIEAAIFDGTAIRKTSQKFALRSEASSRFEKGINEATVREALDAAAALMAALSGGRVMTGAVESNDYEPAPVAVATTLTALNGALGTDLTAEAVTQIFRQLGFDSTVTADGAFTVTIPPRRWDIHIEADLVEEVARIYGYDRLPATLPATGNTIGALTPAQAFRRKTRTTLEAAGLSEIIGYSLTTSEKAISFTAEAAATTTLMLPMTEDRETLRQSLIPGLLDVISYNQNRKNTDLALYELGTIFLPANDDPVRPRECSHVAIALTGAPAQPRFDATQAAVDFYDAKGIVAQLLTGLDDVHFEAFDGIAEMHSGRTARITADGQPLGFVGQVHPATAAQYGIGETYVAELNLERLRALMPAQTTFTEIPRYPAVTRDIALLVDKSVSHAQIMATIASSQVKTLTVTRLFDLYEGDQLPADKKSMAYSLTFQKPDATLTDEEITHAVEKIVKKLVEKCHVSLR